MTSPVQNADEENLSYLIRLLEKTLDWYKVADTKGQLLLTLDGVFITAMSVTVFARPEDLGRRLTAAGDPGTLAISVSAASIALSVLCAVACLLSRLWDARKGVARKSFGVDPADRYTYKPQIAGWFGFIATVSRGAQRRAGAKAGGLLPSYLMTINRDAERVMLASQIVALSRNVLAKHRWVDMGWIFAGIALLGLVGFGLAYAA